MNIPQSASAPPLQSWWEDILKFQGKMMYKVIAALLLAGAALSTPVPEAKAEAEPGYGGYSSGPRCQQHVEKKCHQKPIQKHRQECHEEYDTIVDTTYIEECQDIVTQQCHETHQQVHHSSAVVGHDTHVVAHGHGYGKREAEPEAAAEAGVQGYSSGPKCQKNVERQCQKKPIQKEREECHEEFDVEINTTYTEECEEVVTKHCEEVHTQVHHSSAVVGHDTKVVGRVGGYSHGGHGKREAGHEGYGHSTGPKCHESVEKKCHKIPTHEAKKIPRPVCKTLVDTTYIEECQDIVTEHCQEVSQQVHHSSAVVGHDSQLIPAGGYGHHGK